MQVAQNGLLAVTQFREWRPDFIWMDVGMPVMDGMEATKPIRELDGGRKAKIAALTASAFQSERATVMASGLDDFVCKPYRENEIFECMTRRLGVRFRHGPPANTPVAVDNELLRPEALARLPVAMRLELKGAVVSLDNYEFVLPSIPYANGMRRLHPR